MRVNTSELSDGLLMISLTPACKARSFSSGCAVNGAHESGAGPAPTYHVMKKLPFGGEGRWDTVTSGIADFMVDAVSRGGAAFRAGGAGGRAAIVTSGTEGLAAGVGTFAVSSGALTRCVGGAVP